MFQCWRTKYEDDIRNGVVGTIVGESVCTRAAYLGDKPKAVVVRQAQTIPLAPIRLKQPSTSNKHLTAPPHPNL